MPKKVGVYYLDSASKRPDYFISIEEARRLRESGEAKAVNHGMCVRLTWQLNPKGNMGTGFPKDNSHRYDKIGLEKFPREVVGGLTRTETRPKLNPLYKTKIWKSRSAFTT